jgi:hypothetical protein
MLGMATLAEHLCREVLPCDGGGCVLFQDIGTNDLVLSLGEIRSELDEQLVADRV